MDEDEDPMSIEDNTTMSVFNKYNPAKGIKGEKKVLVSTDFKPKNNVKSWRTLAFFKGSGLMIRFELDKQLIYLSFIEKTTETSYQSFKDGFVIKLDFLALNELLYVLTLAPPQNWDSWREKDSNKFQIKIVPVFLNKFTLNSKTAIDKEAIALKFTVYDTKAGKQIHQFILSPHEMWLVVDMFKDFRQNIIQQFAVATAPTTSPPGNM